MVDFKQAIRWLREGKKVLRPCWKSGSYWMLGVDESIRWSNEEKANVHLNQIEARDWELFSEKFCLSDERIFGYKYNGGDAYPEEKVREFIRLCEEKSIYALGSWGNKGEIILKLEDLKELAGEGLI